MSRLLLIVCFVVGGASQVQAQSELTVDQSHISGLFQAHGARIESWRQGDVLIKVKASGSGGLFGVPAGPDKEEWLTEDTAYIRFIFDFDTYKFLVVKRSQGTATVFDGLGNQIGQPVQAGVSSAGLYDAQRNLCLVKDSEGRIQDLMRIMQSEHRFIGITGVISFMGLGYTHHPQKGWRAQSTVVQEISGYGHVDAIRSVENVGQNRYRVLSVVESPGSVPGGTRVITDWDVKRQVPVHK